MSINYSERIRLKYSEKLIELFRNPRNVGELEDADVKVDEGSPICGDVIRLSLKIEGGRIVDAKFLSFGCAANIATGEVITEKINGLTLSEAEKITIKDVVQEVEGLPAIKMHCAVLATKALNKAIKSYHRKYKGDQGNRISKK